MTTLKLNLGRHMIVSPLIPCTFAFTPSSIAVTLTNHHASSSLTLCYTPHLPTRVRSHSHPFPESDDQVEDLRVPDNWLDPNISLQVLLFCCFQNQIDMSFQLSASLENKWLGINYGMFSFSIIRNQNGLGLLYINGWMMSIVQKKPMWK